MRDDNIISGEKRLPMEKRFDNEGNLIPRSSINNDTTKGKKNPPKNINVQLSPEINVMLDWIHITDGRTRGEIVSDCVRIATILWKYLPPEKLDMIREQDLGSLFKDVTFKCQLSNTIKQNRI